MMGVSEWVFVQKAKMWRQKTTINVHKSSNSITLCQAYLVFTVPNFQMRANTRKMNRNYTGVFSEAFSLILLDMAPSQPPPPPPPPFFFPQRCFGVRHGG